MRWTGLFGMWALGCGAPQHAPDVAVVIETQAGLASSIAVQGLQGAVLHVDLGDQTMRVHGDARGRVDAVDLQWTPVDAWSVAAWGGAAPGLLQVPSAPVLDAAWRDPWGGVWVWAHSDGAAGADLVWVVLDTALGEARLPVDGPTRVPAPLVSMSRAVWLESQWRGASEVPSGARVTGTVGLRTMLELPREGAWSTSSDDLAGPRVSAAPAHPAGLGTRTGYSDASRG